MLSDFKKFLLRGNVVELAVAVIIGAAFNQIVNSLVADVFTPVLGLIGGAPDFSAIKIGPVSIGKFINAVINFLIVASVIFWGVIKPIQKLKSLAVKEEEEKPKPVTEDILLLRDILKTLRETGNKQ
ncbi:MAG: large conductance mechanosensitive channel protein MscL [Deltaproteobacteria bacterium]|nr:large conductance mechanosensitive channel protein MscL [Deltaproteobacteria bacterium]